MATFYQKNQSDILDSASLLCNELGTSRACNINLWLYDKTWNDSCVYQFSSCEDIFKS